MIAGVERILADLYDPELGGFRFSHGGHVTLLSTCFGVMLAYLLRQSLPDRERTCVFVQECQRSDGLFVDPLCQRKDLRGSHSEEYFHWQGTFFSLIALDMLGVLPRHPLRFLAPFVDPDVCRAWYGPPGLEQFLVLLQRDHVSAVFHDFCPALWRTGGFMAAARPRPFRSP